MRACVHQSHDGGELLEVLLLAREEWIPLEMRKDVRGQVGNASCLELDSAIGTVRSETAATEGALEELQHLGAIAVLTYRETRPDLPAEPVTLAAVETHAEASFTVRVPR